MNICVISNSHAASLKSGWDSLCNQFPNVSITFFAAPNRGMTRVKFDSESGSYFTVNRKVSEILCMTSGGYDRIELDEYDAFLVYGLFLEIPRLDVRLSEAVKSATLDETVSNSINFRFVRQLAANADAAVFYSASPMPAENCSLETQDEAVYHSYEETAAWVESRYAHLSARMITQSVDTLNEKNMTQGQYSTGSTRLKVGAGETHSASDTRHMNNVYGSKYLARAVPLIRTHAKNTADI